MNPENIAPSVLHVTASENLDISQDLLAQPSKTISELLNEEEKTDQKD